MNQIREWRVRRGLSQEDLAKTIGCDRTYISALERNMHEARVSTLREIANALRCDVRELIEREAV